MKITLVTPSKVNVTAEAHEWLCGLIAVLTDDQRDKLFRVVAGRVHMAKPQGHIISVPSLNSDESLGNLM
jgi:hypothetical protein